MFMYFLNTHMYLFSNKFRTMFLCKPIMPRRPNYIEISYLILLNQSSIQQANTS